MQREQFDGGVVVGRFAAGSLCECGRDSVTVLPAPVPGQLRHDDQQRRERGLPLSDRVGQNFSGNGDVLAFGFNNDVPINGIGVGYPAKKGVDSVGPVIAGLIDLRETGRLEDGMVIQEGAIPSVLAPILPAVFAGGASLLGRDTDRGDESAERKRVFESLAKGAYRGALHNTQTFLVMAHDSGDGCSAFCTLEGCGDGAIQPGEECDDGHTCNPSGAYCDDDSDCGGGTCQLVSVPGSMADGDGCSAICELETDCGNGVVEAGEQCDDGGRCNAQVAVPCPGGQGDCDAASAGTCVGR